MTGSIKAVIFDLDDTLLDRNATQIRVAKHVASTFAGVFRGISEDGIVAAFLESDLESSAGFYAGEPASREKRFRSFLKRLGVDEDYAGAIAEEYVRVYPSMSVPIPGAVQAVRELSTRFLTGVVSNGLPDVQYRKLDAIGLGGAFSCVVLSEEIGIRKPHPKIFHHASAILQVRPAECIYVGDSYAHDIIGARAAGMKTCWLNPGASPPESAEVSADFVIAGMKELAGILEKAA